MKRIFGFTRTAMIAAALTALPALAQDSGRAGSGAGTGSGATGGQDMSRTSPIEVERHERNFDLGWMGLLGLAGLAGLRRKKTVHTHDVHPTGTVHTNRTDRM